MLTLTVLAAPENKMEPSSNAQSARTQRINLIISWLSVVVAILMSGFYIVGSQGYFNEVSDTPEYILSAKLLVTGQAGSIYNLEEVQSARRQYFPKMRERGLGVLSPPPAVMLLSPFALLPCNVTAEAVWMPVQILAIGLSIWLLLKVYPLPGQALPWFLCWLCMFGPTYDVLRIGQITPLLLLPLAVLIFCLHKAGKNDPGGKPLPRLVAAGIALGAFILKPQEALALGAILLGATRLKILAIAVAFVALLSLLACVVMGPSSFNDFLNVYIHLPKTSMWMAPELTPTIRGQLLRLNLASIAGLVAIVFMMAAIAWCVFYGRKCKDLDDLSMPTLSVFPLGLVTAYLCHTYDLLLLAPTVMALISAAIPQENAQGRHTIMLLLLCSIPFWLPIYAEIQYKYFLGPSPINPFFLALAAFSALSLICLSRNGRCMASPLQT